MTDIFIGLCSSLKKAKIEFVSSANIAPVKITKKECLEVSELQINQDNIKFNDDLVRNLGLIDVKFTEYAPKVFQQLRMLEQLDEEVLIE